MKVRGEKAKLGMFVVAAFLLALVVLATFAGMSLVEKRLPYRVLFSEGVAGLQVGAAVRILGVRVGEVVAIELTREVEPHVAVSVEISDETPIHRNASASLSFQGITGMKDLLVSPGSRETGRLPPGSTIRARGGFDLFGGKGESIGAKLDELLEHLGKLTETDNQRRIAALLDNTNESMKHTTELAKSLTATSQAIGAFVRTNAAPLRGTLQKSGEAAEGVARTAHTWDEVGSSARAALARLDQELRRADVGGTVEGVHQSVAALRQLVERARNLLVTNESELENTMRNVRRASEDLREFSSALRQQPSRLLFSDPPAPRRTER